MMKLFINFELGKIDKYFRTKTLAKVITSFLFFLIFLFISIGIYQFFVSGFRYINVGAEEDIRLALSLFLYELFLLVIASIIIFSAIVSSIFSLFRGGNNNWVISSPLYKFFPKVIFMRGLINSTLPLIIMFLPAILALNKVYSLGALNLFFITISVILFLIMLNASTLAIIIGISFIYYKISQNIKILRFNFNGLIALIIFNVVVGMLFIWKTIISVDLMAMFKADEVSSVVSISNMASHFKFLPTHPFAMEIINWQIGQRSEALFNFLTISFFASISVIVLWFVSFLFYPLWQKFQEGSTQSNTKDNYFFSNRRIYYFSGSKTLALFKKEVLISSRNFKGILWFMFLLFIWLLQIAANVILDNNIRRHEHDISQKIIILQVIQYIIAIYFISSFTLRFVFPSFSIERKTAWILATAPLSFKRIFFGKYLFYTSFFVVVGIIMNYINSRVLNVTFTHAFYSTSLFISVIIFIVTLGLSLGALFPSTETDDPEVISTSMPGLFFTALALIYGAFSDWILYITLTKGSIFWLMLFIIFTFILIGIFLLKIPNLAKNKAY